jgi:hypothetical protein
LFKKGLYIKTINISFQNFKKGATTRVAPTNHSIKITLAHALIQKRGNHKGCPYKSFNKNNPCSCPEIIFMNIYINESPYSL